MSEKKLNELLEKFATRSINDDGSDEIFGELLDQAKSLPVPSEKASAGHLPVWPQATMGLPNAVLRSALFGVIQPGRRNYIDNKEIGAIGLLTVVYTGPRLDQSDLDVWEGCLRLTRESGFGSRIRFQLNPFLTSIGRGKGGSAQKWLKGSLKRLTTANVEISDQTGKAYWGNLIHEGSLDEATGEYVIELNPRLLKLYGKGCWTQIDWNHRRALKQKPLAQWLHGFYATHRQPYAYKVSTIYEICGSTAKTMWRFREMLREALAKVSAVTGWRCWIDATDKVQVQKSEPMIDKKSTA